MLRIFVLKLKRDLIKPYERTECYSDRITSHNRKEITIMGTIINYDNGAVKTCFIPCDCQTEVLYIEYDNDIRMADVALYEYRGYIVGRMSFWQRLRYCWKILSSGRPYCDQLVLNLQQLKELKSFLSSIDM